MQFNKFSVEWALLSKNKTLCIPSGTSGKENYRTEQQFFLIGHSENVCKGDASFVITTYIYI
jgi:hypothetical protein